MGAVSLRQLSFLLPLQQYRRRLGVQLFRVERANGFKITPLNSLGGSSLQ